MTTQVARWGNSLAVRLPKGVVQTARLQEGETVELAVADDGTITLRPVRGQRRLEQLVAGITAENRHDETEWGTTAGNEVW